MGISALISKLEHISVLVDKARSLLYHSAALLFSRSGKPRLFRLRDRRFAKALFNGLPFRG